MILEDLSVSDEVENGEDQDTAPVGLELELSKALNEKDYLKVSYYLTTTIFIILQQSS